MPPDPRVHVGVGAIVERGGHLLMIRRGGVGAFASDGLGTWSVPGGWLERGETPHEAAEREVLEETGVVVVALEDVGFVCCESYNGLFQIVTLFVRCGYAGGEPTVTEPDKCPEVGWVALSEVDDLPLFSPLEALRRKLA